MHLVLSVGSSKRYINPKVLINYRFFTRRIKKVRTKK